MIIEALPTPCNIIVRDPLSRRIVEGIRVLWMCLIGMESATLLTLQRTANHEFCYRDDIAQLDQVARDLCLPVVIDDLVFNQLNAALGTFESRFTSNDSDIVPHQSSDLVPCVGDDHGLVWRSSITAIPRLR